MKTALLILSIFASSAVAAAEEAKQDRIWVELSFGHTHNRGFHQDKVEDQYLNPLSGSAGIALEPFRSRSEGILSHLGFSIDGSGYATPGPNPKAKPIAAFDVPLDPEESAGLSCGPENSACHPCEGASGLCREELAKLTATPRIRQSAGFGAYLTATVFKRLVLRGGTVVRLYNAQSIAASPGTGGAPVLTPYGLRQSLDLVAKADIRIVKQLHAGAEYEQSFQGYHFKTAKWHLAWSFGK